MTGHLWADPLMADPTTDHLETSRPVPDPHTVGLHGTHPLIRGTTAENTQKTK